MTKIERIYHGDALDVLKTLEDNSVDSVCCDPPYGLSKEPDIGEVLTKWLAGDDSFVPNGKGFMSKEWDGFVPPPAIWREVYRVLKPGGHALVFAGTRTQDLMTISLRLAGFEVRDVIEWLYFSGFPKSHDVGKAFDRRRTEDVEVSAKVARFIVDAMEREGLTRRAISEHFNAENIAQQWTTYWTDGAVKPRVPKLDQWAELKRFLNLSDEMDAEVWRLNGRKGKPGDAWEQREKVGESNNGSATGSIVTTGVGSLKREYDITAPATELARKWDGWGTALKPAHEPIIVVRKPLIDADTGRKLTVADCVEKYGTGAINIDASRIDGEPVKIGMSLAHRGNNYGRGTGGRGTSEEYVNDEGRFPANCITLDSDEFYSKYFNVTPQEVPNVTPSDLSKKASKKDRNSDWKGEEIALEPRNNMRVNAPRSTEAEKHATTHGNNHPTVKPTDLMAWLVRLVTPEGGTVLDPFAGSGSTLVAAKREGFGFIGVELTEEYIPIIEARTGVEAEGQAKE